MRLKKNHSRQKRKIRIRKKINGLEGKPRLAIYKSNKNIYVQAIDDLNQQTIATSSTLGEELKSEKLKLLAKSSKPLKPPPIFPCLNAS